MGTLIAWSGGPVKERARNGWGDAVRRLRVERGWRQGELAYHSGVDQSQISKIESGVQDDAYVSTVTKLAAALDVGLDTLFGLRPTASPGALLDQMADDLRALRDEVRRLDAVQRLLEVDRDASLNTDYGDRLNHGNHHANHLPHLAQERPLAS